MGESMSNRTILVEKEENLKTLQIVVKLLEYWE